MGKANPITTDVPGAPFRINQRVRVIKLVDETAEARYLGQEGIVKSFEYDCGCGQQYPHSPMISVHFSDGQQEECWPEELVAV